MAASIRISSFPTCGRYLVHEFSCGRIEVYREGVHGDVDGANGDPEIFLPGPTAAPQLGRL